MRDEVRVLLEARCQRVIDTIQGVLDGGFFFSPGCHGVEWSFL